MVWNGVGGDQLLIVLSEHVVIRKTSSPAMLPLAPLSINDDDGLRVWLDTLYVLCILYCLYLMPSIVTVALLIDTVFSRYFPFWSLR